MLAPLMEGVYAAVDAGKAWAFPASAVLLCLYPAIIFAWTAVEGARAAAPLQAAERANTPCGDGKKQKAPRGGAARRRWLLGAVCVVGAVASGGAFAAMAARQRAAPAVEAAAGTAPPPLAVTGASPPQLSDSVAAEAAPGVAWSAAASAGRLAGAALVLAAAAAGLRRRRRARGGRRATRPGAAASSVVPLQQRASAPRLPGVGLGATTATAAAPVAQEVDAPAGVPTYVAPAPTGHSLWHDIELHVKGWLDEETGLYRYVNEMPMGSLQKFEVQPHLPENAIEEDPKGSKKLAAFGRPVPFNYGCLPQTYRDPALLDEVHGAPGDDDPLDIFDLGDHVAGVGEVVHCRPLGAVCLIDEGQADWKVLAVSTGHGGPLAEARSIEDVERLAPGRVAECLKWIDDLKKESGKGDATLHYEIHDAAFATRLIEQDYKSWQALVAEAASTGSARGHWVRRRDAALRPSPVPAARFGMPWTLPRGLKAAVSAPSVLAGMQHAEALLAHARATAHVTSPTTKTIFPSSP